jgi:di/tripeptidase
MVNALSLASRIHALVPADESPENTEGYEGFTILPASKAPLNARRCITSFAILTAKHLKRVSAK